MMVVLRSAAWCLIASLLSMVTTAALSRADQPAVIRAGMIGLDTSHVPAFTKIFNSPDANGSIGQVQIVAAYPGGTDLPASRDRVEGFTNQLRDAGVEIVDTIPQLLEKVDVVFLESVDGRIHLEEAIPVILAGKPMYIDKPAAGTLADCIAIFDLAKKHNTPVFSCSALRYAPQVQTLLQNESLGTIQGAEAWGPCSYQEGLPDLFYYGVHGIEVLYTLMGEGCQSLVRTQTENTDVVTGVWADGRVGGYRGIRAAHANFGAVAFGSKAIVSIEKAGGYEPLCQVIADFFVSKQPPVSAETTIELFAFMEAADVSKANHGARVVLADVIDQARKESRVRLAHFGQE